MRNQTTPNILTIHLQNEYQDDIYSNGYNYEFGPEKFTRDTNSNVELRRQLTRTEICRNPLVALNPKNLYYLKNVLNIAENLIE